jgi:nicotinamide-nucleotide amidase
MPAPSQEQLEQLARELGDSLAERGWLMSTAESCTGGWIAQCMTAIAGSSGWFEAGIVSYSNAAKMNFLNVNPMTLERHGAVSGETASEMVAGARTATHTDVAVAVTGVAGPGGGTDEKPVGLVWFGFSVGAQPVQAIAQHFPGERREIRARTVEFALQELIRALS